MKAASPYKSGCFTILFSSSKCNFGMPKLAALIGATVIMILLFIFYYCPRQTCHAPETVRGNLNHLVTEVNFTLVQDIEADPGFGSFDSEHDVLVFLHIQKTGGSCFGRHVALDTQGFPAPCRCQALRRRCNCRDRRGRFWLFSRESLGWACGLHADWTELHECVPKMLNKLEHNDRKRRYLYITSLRDPVQRYLSEWKHVQRGGTWRKARLMCNKRPATLQEVPYCFKGENWGNVTLDEFMDCPHNLATNRQTRMLANLSLVGCYDSSVIVNGTLRQSIMLNSALANLRQLAFFGLMENQSETQRLFEHTFDVQFTENFFQGNITNAEQANVTAEQLHRIIQLNRLDIELYSHAKQLFETRVSKISSDYDESDSRTPSEEVDEFTDDEEDEEDEDEAKDEYETQ